MEYKIRTEQAKDIEQVRTVVRAAFPGDAESRLVDVLRANGKAIISLVAVNGDHVVGHILFSRVSIISSGAPAPSSDVSGIGLAPVAVRPDVQSQGIGSQLIREGLRFCRELGYDYCVVLGSPEYYQRFGFEKASVHGIQNEYGVDGEFMIVHFSDRRVIGLAKYEIEFAELSV